MPLTIAFFVNAAILVLAAMVFYGKTSAISGGETYAFDANTDWIRVAYLTLAPLLGTVAASLLFAIGLLASGQASTITGTLAGQVVMEGFMHWRISPWLRRVITRTLAIIPAILIIGIRGQQQHQRSAESQPGCAGPAVAAGDVPPAAFHLFPQAHGPMEAGLVPADHRMDQRRC